MIPILVKDLFGIWKMHIFRTGFVNAKLIPTFVKDLFGFWKMYIFRTGFVNAKLLFLQHNHICNLQLLKIIENGLHLFFDTVVSNDRE